MVSFSHPGSTTVGRGPPIPGPGGEGGHTGHLVSLPPEPGGRGGRGRGSRAVGGEREGGAGPWRGGASPRELSSPGPLTLTGRRTRSPWEPAPAPAPPGAARWPARDAGAGVGSGVGTGAWGRRDGAPSLCRPRGVGSVLGPRGLRGHPGVPETAAWPPPASPRPAAGLTRGSSREQTSAFPTTTRAAGGGPGGDGVSGKTIATAESRGGGACL